jgi:hypothetical protein
MDEGLARRMERRVAVWWWDRGGCVAGLRFSLPPFERQGVVSDIYSLELFL